MAVIDALPNGYLVVTLSPREAVMLMDQILEPSDYPWQSNESQMVALEVKSAIRGVVESLQHAQTRMLASMIPAQQPGEQEEE